VKAYKKKIPSMKGLPAVWAIFMIVARICVTFIDIGMKIAERASQAPIETVVTVSATAVAMKLLEMLVGPEVENLISLGAAVWLCFKDWGKERYGDE
jgi:hypothetical protein